MSKRTVVRQGLWAALLCLLTEGALLMLLAWGGAEGWLDAERLLTPLLAAVCLAAVMGALLLRRWRWSAFPAAVLTGIGMQLPLLLAGYLLFGGVALDGNRWLLPVAGFAAALAAGLLPRGKRPAGKGRKHRRGKRRG